MWRRASLVVFTACVGMIVCPAWAADAPSGKDSKPHEKDAGGKDARADKKNPQEAKDTKDAKKTPRAPTTQVKDGLTGDYAVMAEELALSDAQKTQLADKVAAREAAIKAWTDANKAKLADLRKSADEAQANKNADKAKEFNTAIKALEDEREGVIAKADADIEGVLTPDQVQKWQGIRAYRVVTARLRKVDLTEAQQQQIKARCLAASTGLSNPDRKARSVAMQSLMNSIDKEVLTEAQQEKMGLPKGDKNKPALHKNK